MNFDDYNYNQYNEYVLIEEPNEADKRRIINDRRKLDRNQVGTHLSVRENMSVENLDLSEP